MRNEVKTDGSTLEEIILFVVGSTIEPRLVDASNNASICSKISPKILSLISLVLPTARSLLSICPEFVLLKSILFADLISLRGDPEADP